MNCLHCTHLDLRTHPKHAAVGLGQCKHQKLPGVFEMFTRDRECGQFAAADPETAQKRLKWNESRGK